MCQELSDENWKESPEPVFVQVVWMLLLDVTFRVLWKVGSVWEVTPLLPHSIRSQSFICKNVDSMCNNLEETRSIVLNYKITEWFGLGQTLKTL